MPEPTRTHAFQLLGWVLFVACAGCYIAANIRSGDRLSLAGSILFLLACMVFLAPLIVNPPKK